MLKRLSNGFIIGGKAKDVFRMIAQMAKDEALNKKLQTRMFTDDDILWFNLNKN